MVIDKWTRTTSNINNNLITPLLGHKSKETFLELKQSFEKLKSLNRKFKKWKSSPIPEGYKSEINNELIDIKDYLQQINLTLISIDELISENDNCEVDEEKHLNMDQKNNIFDEIDSECDIFIENMKDLKKNNIFSYDFDINSSFNKCRNGIISIYKKIKKDKNIENISFINQQSNNSIINTNPNIDRGQINIFSSKREFNNSITLQKNNIQFSVEEESLSNLVKLILFCFGIGFMLFVCYICIV